nr:MAG TPA: hypothetical protein [Caudoviricetes sp.]
MISCHFYCSSAEYPYHKYICIKQLKREIKYKLKKQDASLYISTTEAKLFRMILNNKLYNTYF